MKHFISLLLCCLCLPLMGQQRVPSLQMQVLDTKNQPIEYANVAFYLSSDTTLAYGGITDANGSFRLEEIKPQNYILKVSYIGYANYERNFTPQEGLNTLEPIILSDSDLSLDEITVVGHRPLVSMKDGILTTRVENSLLSSLGTAEDVLQHIPGLEARNNEYSVLGKGEVVIYIDNQKVFDNSELQNLDSKHILDVELITNPGAEYDAETRSVLKITTNKKHRIDGFSLSLRGQALQSHKFSHGERIEMNYHHKGLNVSALYGFNERKNKETYDLTYQSTGDTLWRNNTETFYNKRNRNHDLTTSLQYDFNPNHTAGARYRLLTTDFKNHPSTGRYELFADDVLMEQTNTSGPNFIDQTNHQLNAFYQGTFAEKFNLQANFDYVKQNQQNSSQIREESLLDGNSIRTNTENDNQFRIYAGKIVLHQQEREHLAFTYGAEYSLVKGNGRFRSNILNKNDFYNREEKLAAFASTNFSLKNLSIGVGLRYEYVRSKTEENGETIVNRKYSNLFPSLNFSLPVGETNMSLNFSNRISRSSFSTMNNNITYINRFHQKKGNPALQPEKIYDLDYTVAYKFLQFRLNYRYVHDYITFYTQPSEVSPAVTLSSFTNYPKFQQLTATLIASHKIRAWMPTLSVMAYKQFFTASYENIAHTYEKPMFDFTLQNYFTLPQGIILNIDLCYNTGGNGGTTFYADYGTINVGIRKSFLNDALQLALWGYDLGQWYAPEIREQLGRLQIRRHALTETRYAALTITWRFNNFKNKYKGQSAARDEMNRL